MISKVLQEEEILHACSGWETAFEEVVKESPERGRLGLLAIKTTVSTKLAKLAETGHSRPQVHKDKNIKAEGFVGMVVSFVWQC